MTNPRSQLNVRVSEEVERLIDDKRVTLKEKLGHIPTRSDILQVALGAFLKVDISKLEVDGLKAK